MNGSGSSGASLGTQTREPSRIVTRLDRLGHGANSVLEMLDGLEATLNGVEGTSSNETAKRHDSDPRGRPRANNIEDHISYLEEILAFAHSRLAAIRSRF